MPEQRGVGVKPEGISRRRFITGLPLAAAVAAGVLASGREEVAAYSADGLALSKESGSYLTCLAQVRRVERYDHTNYTNGMPWKGCEIQADCTAYDGFGQEFPLHLYYAVIAWRKGAEEETDRILSILRPGTVLVVSGCVSFFEEDVPPTIYGANLRDLKGEVLERMGAVYNAGA